MGNPNNTLSWTPYDNIELYHPGGKLMCFLSNKRANWYLKKGLVKILGDKKIQLLFEPKGDGEPLELLESRSNICVVNGDSEFLTRHHVIPSQFRKQFQLKYKDKNCFDLVLLGREIHDEYEKHATILKDKLYANYVSSDIKEFYFDFTLGRNLCGIVKKHFEKVPAPRQIYIQMKLEGLREKWNLTNEDFNAKSPYDIQNYNKKIVDALGEEKLIVMWKHHFIKWAKPKYLPEWWKSNLIKINKKEGSEIYYYVMDSEIIELLNKYDCI